MPDVKRDNVLKLSIGETLHRCPHAISPPAKRQKLGSIIKRVRRNLISLNQLSNQIQYDIVNLHKRISDIQHEYDHKIAWISAITYRSLSRVHRLFITFTPYIPMTVEIHSDVS